MRIKIAEHMVLSKRTSAHVTTIHRVDMTKVAKTRERSKAEFQAAYGFSLTYLPFLTRAAARRCATFLAQRLARRQQYRLPQRNQHRNRVALENGLIVPVSAAPMKERGRPAARHCRSCHRARTRQLKPDEVQGGTFSITNFGSYGSLVGTPIINQPQVGHHGRGHDREDPGGD